MTQLLPPKKEVALALLERSNVDVYLDPRADGVVVPPQFRKEPRLILKIGLNMPVPIPDLRLDDESMSCTLSFNRTKFFCVVPWMSVFAMVGDDGRGMVWPDDVPQELAVRPENKGPALAPAPSEEAAPTPSSRGKGKSRLQPDAVKESENVAASERGPQSKRPARKKAAKNGRELEGVKRDDAAAPERARPVLVAVPSPKSSPRVEKLDDHREASASLAERPEREQRPAAPRMPAAPPRPKRELPPYLRVVK